MENIDRALAELDRITSSACSGALTETMCRKELDAFRSTYGDTLFHGRPLGDDIRRMPAGTEKLRELKIIRAQGGTPEELFLEMARTGRALRRKRLAGIIAVFAAIAAVVALIVALIRLK